MSSDLRSSQEPRESGLTMWLLYLYIGSLILLPSGTLKGIPLKIPLFIPLAAITWNRIARASTTASFQVGIILSVAGLLALWTVWSLTHPFFSDYALSQAKDILTTLCGCLIIRVLTQAKDDQIRFARACIMLVTLGSFLKVALLGYALLTGGSVADYVQALTKLFGVSMMSVDLADSGGRLLLPSDNLIPICLFALLALRRQLHFRWLSAVCTFPLLIASSLYTFSRFIWASALICIVLGFFIGKRDRLNLFYIALSGILVAVLFPMITTIVELRFSENLSGASDLERVWQASVLRDFFVTAPLFGHGLGSYSLQMKRSYETPYSYELQVLAMFGQFGLIGVGLLTACLINFYRKAFSFRCRSWIMQLSLLMLLIDLLASGFFNPSLLVSMSAAAYGLIFILAKLNQLEDPLQSKTHHRTEYGFVKHVTP